MGHAVFYSLLKYKQLGNCMSLLLSKNVINRFLSYI
jgi:hypothetical protein